MAKTTGNFWLLQLSKSAKASRVDYMKQILRLAEFSKWGPQPSTLRTCHSSKVGTPQCATPISLTAHAALTSSSKSSQLSQPQTKFEDPCTHLRLKKESSSKLWTQRTCFPHSVFGEVALLYLRELPSIFKSNRSISKIQNKEDSLFE